MRNVFLPKCSLYTNMLYGTTIYRVWCRNHYDVMGEILEALNRVYKLITWKHKPCFHVMLCLPYLPFDICKRYILSNISLSFFSNHIYVNTTVASYPRVTVAVTVVVTVVVAIVSTFTQLDTYIATWNLVTNIVSRSDITLWMQLQSFAPVYHWYILDTSSIGILQGLELSKKYLMIRFLFH